MDNLLSPFRPASFSVGCSEHRLLHEERQRNNPPPQEAAKPQEPQPNTPDKQVKTPEAKPGEPETTQKETTSIFGEDPQKAADWGSTQFRQRAEYATLEGSQNLQRVGGSEQNKFDIV